MNLKKDSGPKIIKNKVQL